MNLYIRAISINFIFFSINAVFFLSITPFAIREMGAEFYGLWVVLLAIMMLANIGNLGVDATVMKFSSEDNSHDEGQTKLNSVITSGYILALIMAVLTASLLLVIRNLISAGMHTNLELRKEFQQAIFWIAASILPQFLTRVPHGFLLSQLYNKEARQFELLSSISLWVGAFIISIIQKNSCSNGLLVFPK